MNPKNIASDTDKGREAITDHLKFRKALLEDYVAFQAAQAKKMYEHSKWPADCPLSLRRSMLLTTWVPASPLPDLNAEIAAQEAERIGEILDDMEGGGMDDIINRMTEAWGPAVPRAKE